MPPNGLELSCPAEAGKLSITVRQASGRFKHPRRPSPPGQLQRVVRRRRLESKDAPYQGVDNVQNDRQR
jgi:hypothetical protein